MAVHWRTNRNRIDLITANDFKGLPCSSWIYQVCISCIVCDITYQRTGSEYRSLWRTCTATQERYREGNPNLVQRLFQASNRWPRNKTMTEFRSTWTTVVPSTYIIFRLCCRVSNSLGYSGSFSVYHFPFELPFYPLVVILSSRCHSILSLS